MGKRKNLKMALSASDVSQFKELATADGAKAQTMLGEIKLKIALSTAENTAEKLALERDVFETAAMLSIRMDDIEGFERHISMLKPYYLDYGDMLPASAMQEKVLGLNLLRLLAQGSLDAFHIELETISPAHLSSTAVQFPVQLEQLSMEGSYHKVMAFQKSLPSPEYQVFMTTLSDTLRDEIASCLEASYKSLPCSKAAELLMMEIADLGAFCEEREWVVSGDRIALKSETVEKKEIPALALIEETLHYATELERIV